MKNIEASIKNNVLTIKIDLSKTHGRSSTGKSVIVSTSSGAINLSKLHEKDYEGNDDLSKMYLNLTLFRRD